MATEIAPSDGDRTIAAAGPDGGIALSLRGVRHRYDELVSLDRIDLELPAGGVLGLVGPSGCGKSTLLELICGLREADAGTIDAGGAATAAQRLRLCAYMPQRDTLLPWLSAIDNASLALRNRGIGRAEARRLATPQLERLGLTGFAASRPAELSGGMRQRVAFLRTLLAGKPLLALDEPFAALDAITRAEVQGWLAAALRAEPRTVVLVTHDVEEALYLADRALILSPRPGRVVAAVTAPSPRAADRDAAVTAPAFIAARERAMAALRS